MPIKRLRTSYETSNNNTNNINFSNEIETARDANYTLYQDINEQHFSFKNTEDSICLNASQITKGLSLTSHSDTIFQQLSNKYLSQNNDMEQKSLSQSQNSCSNYDKGKSSLSESLENNTIFKTPTKTKSLSSVKTSSTNVKSIQSPFVQEDSIDLTDNDSAAEEDDCLILSDEEINYSIWKANKTLNFKTESISELQDLYKENEQDLRELTLDFGHEVINSPKHNLNFSLIHLMDNCKLDKKSTSCLSNFDNDVEPICSQYLAKPVNALHKERQEFGIMESNSPAFTASQLKESITAEEALAEASFLESPSEKRISINSNKKFNQLFSDITNNHSTNTDSFDDYDEFDRLVYGSPKKTSAANTSTLPPAGFSQLLNAEISFNAQDTVQFTTPTKQKISPFKKCNTQTPPQELELNGHKYVVRLTYSPKPDFCQQSDAELLKQLYNFGIKPLKRKHAVLTLEYIYNQTHPLVVDENDSNIWQEKNTDFELSPLQSPIKSTVSSSQISSIKSNSAATKKINFQDCDGKKLLQHSNFICPHLPGEEYIFQTNVSKKVSS